MNLLSRPLVSFRRMADTVIRRRDRLPKIVNRVIDHIADNPDSALGLLAARSLGPIRPQDIPPPTAVPDSAYRVLIGPTNYAEQGWAWARAIDAAPDDAKARNLAVDVPGGFSFRADTIVPVPVYTLSEDWQRAELAAAEAFSHVLFEAERPLFGRLFGRSVEREAAHLAGVGVSTAFLGHGTDIRLPSRHLTLTPWSPFADDGMYVQKLERDAARNIDLLARSGRPLFVSTPDLLIDVPGATWCPVVVDAARWAAAVDRDAGHARTRVAHVPSKSGMKGTPLIEPTLAELVDAGIVDYEPISGIPSAQMPIVYGRADIVLDQFRLGSYGVAACEAMAAGAVVVGHIAASVRESVKAASGLELPIVEATPDTLGAVLRELAGDADRRAALAAEGERFVSAVHDGRRSSRTLLDGWVLA